LRNQLSSCGRAFPDNHFFSLFMLVADTACAKIHTFLFTSDHNDGRVDVRLPTAVGMPFRVADGITELRGFPTNIALQ